ncbi:hypothetical protein Tco_0755289, partial [Tanacetum coccineum]
MPKMSPDTSDNVQNDFCAVRLLGAYNLGVKTPRALVHAGDKTSRDARSCQPAIGLHNTPAEHNTPSYPPLTAAAAAATTPPTAVATPSYEPPHHRHPLNIIFISTSPSSLPHNSLHHDATATATLVPPSSSPHRHARHDLLTTAAFTTIPTLPPLFYYTKGC